MSTQARTGKVKAWIGRITLPALLAAASGCTSAPGTEPPPANAEMLAELVVEGLASPVYLTSPPGDDRLFIVEQGGRVLIHDRTTLQPVPFLDIRDRVVSGGERGLLSMAFHPNYATNGRFYVNYTGTGGATHIERYSVSTDPARADEASAVRLMSVPQPFANHNGGLVTFGPDGMLYIGMGDGGSGGDPQGHGQSPGTLLGALLRVDVDGGEPYGIPRDNPFVDSADGLEEVWAIGLRNPWRFSFDHEEEMLYIADVGQNRFEEVNARPAAEAGLNYGWKVLEGAACYPSGSSCDRTGLVEPIHVYSNSAEGCSVTGGYVYRGSALPQLRGHYFYGDYCRGVVRSLRLAATGDVTDHREWPLGRLGNISSFGEDADGELYVVSHQGSVYKLVP